MAEETLAPREVADRLGVTVRTVQRWIAAGRLPAYRVGGRLRIPREAVGRVAPTPAVGHGALPRTLLIANRGEIARRIARTAGALGIRTIGLHQSDEPAPPGMDRTRPIRSYLDGGEIVAAALATGADAIHPGYGFLAESPAFARAVGEAGLTWVGPPPEAIAAMGDKAAARRLVAAHGVAVVPGYDGPDQDDARLGREARRIGVPLLVKPSAGGGGKGMRVVRTTAELEDALAASRREAARAFGDDRIILERLVERARHVEVQVLFDAHGSGVHLGERDCSAQRRNQKIVEEAPGPAVDAALRERMGAAALAAAAAVGYVNAGTVEFLLGDDGAFYFIEMNTRLQVEHPVTEAVTGRDLVADQLRIAAGEPLGFDQAAVRLEGHAVEARIYAEDPDAGFLPATGRLVALDWPTGDGIRLDAGIDEGDVVSDRFDPMLAKIVAHGADRAEALERLAGAVARTTLLGVRSNVRFLRQLLDAGPMRAGEMRTDTIAGLDWPRADPPSVAAWTSAAEAALAAGLLPPGAWGGGWRLNAAPVIRLRSGDHERTVTIALADASPSRSAVDVERRSVFVDDDGQSVEFAIAPAPAVDEASRHAGAGAAALVASVVAPMPGRVIAVQVEPGQAVAAHQVLVVVEAMKMEHAVTATAPGTVERVTVAVGQQVERGELLVDLR